MSETEPFSEFRGGAISRWAANVVRNDQDFVVLCPSTDDSWGFPNERVVAMPNYHRFEKIRRASLRLPRFVQEKMIRAVLIPGIRNMQPGDTVWVHNRPDYAAILAPFVHQAGGRVVAHLHNSHLAKEPAERILNAKIDHFIFGSQFLQQEALERFPGIASSVLNYGANEALFFPPATERDAGHVPKILFASRLVKEKGGHIFLEAMRLLAEQGVQAQGIMVGAAHFGGSKTTPYIASLHSLAPPNVELRPYTAGMELADMFREADIFCAPVIWDEPFGMVNVEAFATGIPVVGTHGGGSKEVFKDGGGLLVERGSVEQLVEALKKLILDPALRKQIASDGRASFRKNFTWNIIHERYRNVVSTCLA